MKARLITAAIAIPLVIGVLIAPWPWLFTLFFFLVSAALSWEIMRFSKRPDPHVIAVNFISLAGLYLAKYFGFFEGHPGLGELPMVSAILFFNFFAAGAIYIASPRLENALTNLALSSLALFYGGFILSYGVDLRFLEVVRHSRESFANFLRGLPVATPADQVGVLYVFYVLLVAWMCDTGAYVIGSAFGKNNRIGLTASPNKSWAGLIGGLLTAVATYLGFHFFCQRFFPEAFDASVFSRSMGTTLLVTVALALCTQIGDLIESVLKRAAGVKDSGTLLRGHGGMFDAIDSVVPSLFLFHFYLTQIWPRIQG
ncbi:MAG: phosphatidate cytidylyltransferase [Spirochaetes bacterium]|nr:phosphatidate cytidylyltransferase [Spirochaetota bacterium]